MRISGTATAGRPRRPAVEARRALRVRHPPAADTDRSQPAGLLKHLTGVELLYLGYVFDRHFGEPVPWFRPDLGPSAFEPNTDMWATAEQSREYIVDMRYAGRDEAYAARPA
jgi:hypothetical protein